MQQHLPIIWRIAFAFPGWLILPWAIVAVAIAGDQPQWGERYSRNMVSDETGLPDSFDPHGNVNVKWSVPLGTSTYSTPVIAGGKVLIGTNNDEPRDPRHEGDRGVLLCLDEKDGRFCWQLVVPKLTGARVDAGQIGIVSPATVEGDRVYIVSNRNEVMCLGLTGMANGTDVDIRWSFDINAALGVHQHDAAHSSVLVHGQYLYVCTSNGVDNSHVIILSPKRAELDRAGQDNGPIGGGGPGADGAADDPLHLVIARLGHGRRTAIDLLRRRRWRLLCL